MKKLAFTIAITVLAFAAFGRTTVSEKVIQAFAHVFPGVDDAKWHETETFYEAYFEKDGMKCRVRFDREGKILQTIRYYSEDKLCPFLRAKVAQRFSDKKIFGVTEVTTESELSYNLILEDKKSWTHVKCSGTGDLEITEKFRKSEQ